MRELTGFYDIEFVVKWMSKNHLYETDQSPGKVGNLRVSRLNQASLRDCKELF